MTTTIKGKIIDADAHVVETERTWDFMEPDEQKYRPVLYGSLDGTGKQAWNIGGKIRGTTFNLNRQQLAELSKKQGFELNLSPEGRDLDDIGARLAVQLFHHEQVARLDPVLFAAGLDHRVHRFAPWT